VDRTVGLWDVITGKQKAVLGEHTATVISVTFSDDGKLLASCGGADYAVCLWDVTNGTKRVTLCGHTDSAWRVAFSHDGTLLASGSHDGTVRLWDVDAVLKGGK
jgi:WD40 repeat protein